MLFFKNITYNFLVINNRNNEDDYDLLEDDEDIQDVLDINPTAMVNISGENGGRSAEATGRVVPAPVLSVPSASVARASTAATSRNSYLTTGGMGTAGSRGNQVPLLTYPLPCTT